MFYRAVVPRNVKSQLLARLHAPPFFILIEEAILRPCVFDFQK